MKADELWRGECFGNVGKNLQIELQHREQLGRLPPNGLELIKFPPGWKLVTFRKVSAFARKIAGTFNGSVVIKPSLQSLERVFV